MTIKLYLKKGQVMSEETNILWCMKALLKHYRYDLLTITCIIKLTETLRRQFFGKVSILRQ